MIELPEAVVLAHQINQTLVGKRIGKAVANQSPHKFAWYTGDPAAYNERLAGKTILVADAAGGNVEVQADDMRLVLSAALRYYRESEKLPPKHQLLLAFEDGAALVGTVQMWGWLLCVGEGEPIDSPDYHQGRERPSPLTDAFDRPFFDRLRHDASGDLSAKAFLATEQRIPGLGNGVLQDILWTARIHPRRKLATLLDDEMGRMYDAVKSVLHAMAEQGGRDTERDLFAQPGGYKTILSKHTVGTLCPACGSTIQKATYLGGSIYFCPACQKI